MPPVHVVHLDLAEVPLVFAVVVETPLERLGIAVVREAEVADVLLLAQFHAPVECAVVEVALRERLEAAVADGVQKVVVDVVRAEKPQRSLEHLFARLQWILLRREVGELGGDDVVTARVAVCGQRLAEAPLGLASTVRRRRVEVVHAVVEHVLDLSVQEFLVDSTLRGSGNPLVGVSAIDGRKPHRAVAEEGCLASACRESRCHANIIPYIAPQKMVNWTR